MGKTRTTLFAMLIALALPGTAAAASGFISGNAGAYQYVESIPTAGGQRITSTVHAAEGANAGSQAPTALSSATQQALNRAGPTGRQLSALVAATGAARVHHATISTRAHGSVRGHGHAGVTGSGSQPPSGAAGGGQSSSAAVAASVTGLGGGGSSGIVLALILVAIAAAAVAIRLRRSTPTD